MRKLLACCIFLYSFSSASYGQSSIEDVVNISLSMTAKTALEVRYDVPVGCKRLEFANQGIGMTAAAAIRRNWTAIDRCSRIDESGIQLGDSCTSARFRVPTEARDIDRIYPWAHPLADGVYAHTSAYAINASCAPSSWKFSGPGTVIVDGQIVAGNSGKQGIQFNYLPVVFFDKQTKIDGNVYIDPSFASETNQFLRKTIDSLLSNYRVEFPALNIPQPFLIVVPASGAWRFRGDVAGRNTMRLMMTTFPSASDMEELRTYFAHEGAHLLQPLAFEDKWGEELSMIKEGGAEMLSWLSGARLGWDTPEVLSNKAESAINTCLIASGGGSWRALPNRHWARLPYDCGFAFHLMALSTRADQRAASLTLSDYYLAAGTLKGADFSQALECGAVQDCKANWLPRLLAGDRPLSALFDEFSNTTGLIKPLTEWAPNQIDAVARKTFSQLMSGDCGGQISYFSEPGGVRIGPVSACKTLREGMNVIAAGSTPLFGNRAAAVRVVNDCHRSGKTVLTLSDSKSIEIACTSAVSNLPTLYSVDVVAILSKMKSRARGVQP